MSSYLIESKGLYFRGLESYQPDYGGYQFRRRTRPVWGTKEQAVVFPSYKSAQTCLRRHALALGAKIWPVEGDHRG